MFMFKDFLFIFVLLSSINFNNALKINSSFSKMCSCHSENITNEYLNNNGEENYIVEDEIINGRNLGRPIFIKKGLAMLLRDFIVIPQIEEIDNCPHGWRLPKTDEIRDIIRNFGRDSYDKMVNSLNFNPNKIYLLKDKLSKILDPNDSRAYDFNGLVFNVLDKSVRIMKINTLTNKNIWMKCVLNSETYRIDIKLRKRYKNESFTLNKFFNAYINNTNIVSRKWRYGNITSNSTIFPVRFLKEKCNNIHLYLKLISGEVISSCQSFYIYKNDSSEQDDKFSIDQIQEKIYDIKAVRFDKIYFSPGTTPFAPTHNGGLFIIYTHKEKKVLRAIEVDKNSKIIRKYSLNHSAYALDVIRHKNGFIILCRDFVNENLLYILSYDRNFLLNWKRIIMNNKVNPIVAEKDQIIFHKNEKNQTEFGMNAMFKVQSGRLSFSNGKIAVIFSHFNNFNTGNLNVRNDHTGDSLVIFDIQNKNPPCLIYSWGTSPSLSQTLINNNKNIFISASLGGGFPENIRVTAANSQFLEDNHFDPVLKYNYKYKSITNQNFIPGDIPADGFGHSCGRLGGLVSDDNYKTFGLVYSRKKCKLTADNNITSRNYHDEFGIIFFDENLKQNNHVIFGEGSKIINIKTARLRDNILILYGETEDEYSKYEVLDNTLDSKMKMYLMLVDFNGKIVFKPKLFEGKHLPTTDDLRTLKDGSVAWTFVDVEGKIHLYKAN